MSHSACPNKKQNLNLNESWYSALEASGVVAVLRLRTKRRYMNDDFDGSDVGDLFAEVDRLQAGQAVTLQAPPALGERPAATINHHDSPAPGTTAFRDIQRRPYGTPQTAALRSEEIPATTPRSREEIRRLFSKRAPAPQHVSLPQHQAGQPVHVPSRFHPQPIAQIGTTQPGAVTNQTDLHARDSSYGPLQTANVQSAIDAINPRHAAAGVGHRSADNVQMQPAILASHVRQSVPAAGHRSLQQDLVQLSTLAKPPYQTVDVADPRSGQAAYQPPSSTGAPQPTDFSRFAHQRPSQPAAMHNHTLHSIPSAAPSNPIMRPSGQSATTRNSINSNCRSGSSAVSHASTGSAAAQRNSISSQPSGPCMRAEIMMGPSATLEVNVRHHDNVAAAIKRVRGEWVGNKGLWRVPMTHYRALLDALASVPGVRLTVEPLPAVAHGLVQAASGVVDDSERFDKLPSKLQERLMGFQREGICFALKKGGRLLIGDEMGLGKTVQAIAIMACYQDEWPCVIVTPSSLREQWADALHQWLGITDDHVHIVTKGKDCQLEGKQFKFLITSYNFMGKLKESLQTVEPKVMVLDEAHSIKASKSARTVETLPFLKSAKRVVLLTGTPALSRPKELFSLLTALAPSAKIKMKDFGERYCQCDRWRPYGGQYDGASNLGELNRLLSSTVMIRRLKNDVLEQLPPKRRQHVYLQLQEPQLGQMKGLRSALENARELKQKEADGARGLGGDKSGQQMIMELYQKCAALKSKAVAEHVNLLLEADEKFLIFSHHAEMHNTIEAAVRGKKGVKFIRIDGSTPAQTRGELVNKFQQNAEYRVAILSINAAGTGLTLTAASTVVFAEYSWTPGTLVQAEDRVHRIGQANSVNVYYLHAKGSIDDIIWQTLEHKLDDVGQVLNGKSDSFQMVKSQQQVSAKQGKLDAYMGPSQSAGAGPSSNTTPYQPAQAHAQPVQGLSQATQANRAPPLPSIPRLAQAPKDVTNMPSAVSSKTQQGSASAASPGKQTRLQSFFQPKQTAAQQAPSDSRPVASWMRQGPVVAPPATTHQLERHSSLRHEPTDNQMSAGPNVNAARLSGARQELAACPNQQQMHAQALQQPAPQQAKASGVFADDDDDVWVSDDFLMGHYPQTLGQPSAQPAPLAHASMQPEMADVTGPAHKKSRTSDPV